MGPAPEPDLAEQYDVQQTVDYVLQGGYKNIALQFPDELLADSPAVSQMLQERLADRARVFILADTAYNPLGVDEVAAQHLAANCVIHYGRASLVPVHSLPAFFVLPKEAMHAPATAAALAPAIAAALRARAAAVAAAGDGASGGGFRGVVLLLDQAYQHRLPELREAMGEAMLRLEESQAAASRPPLIFATVPARSLHPAKPRTAPAAAAAPAGGCRTSATAEPAAVASAEAAAATASCCNAAAAASASTHSGAAAEAAGRACCGTFASGSCTQARETAPEPDASPAPCGGVSCSGISSGSGSAGATQQGSVASGPAAGSGDAGPRPADPAAAGCTTCGSTDPQRGCNGSQAADSQAAPCCHGKGGGDGRDGIGGSGGDGDCGDGEGDGGGSTVCMAGLSWRLPPGAARADCLYVWVGPAGSSAQQVLQLTHAAAEWLSYDPAEAAEVRAGLSDETRRLLKRRNFMVEKARAANIVGLLVGTLGSAGFLDVISALRRLAAAAGKKTYTFLMGKPNPAKLGNFPEVDVFVCVADAQGLMLDSRDYLAPLVTPWEAALALTGRHLDPQDYRMELTDVLAFERELQQQQQGGEGPEGCTALQALGGLSLATRGSGGGRGEVVARSAAEYLALKRTFKGLEMPATGASPKAAELAREGLSGRAAGYTDEGQGEQGAGAGAAAW